MFIEPKKVSIALKSRQAQIIKQKPVATFQAPHNQRNQRTPIQTK